MTRLPGKMILTLLRVVCCPGRASLASLGGLDITVRLEVECPIKFRVIRVGVTCPRSHPCFQETRRGIYLEHCCLSQGKMGPCSPLPIQLQKSPNSNQQRLTIMSE